MKSLLIKGDFTTQEIKLFAELLRVIERVRPTEHFQMLIVDPENQPLDEMDALVRQVFPALKGDTPFITTLAPHDYNGGPVCQVCGEVYNRVTSPTWCPGAKT